MWLPAIAHLARPAPEGATMPRVKTKNSSQRKVATAVQPAGRPAGTSAVASAVLSAPDMLPGLLTTQELPPGLRRVHVPAALAADAAPAANPGLTALAGPAAPPESDAEDMSVWAAKALEEVLSLTYWLDPGQDGEAFSATISFSGHRTGVTGTPQPADQFTQEETVSGIVPGSGPVAITTTVRGVNAGQWMVSARPVTRRGSRTVRPYPPSGEHGSGPGRTPWPRRVRIPAGPPATARTARAAAAKVPGIIRGSYGTLVGLGMVVGLGLEVLLLHLGRDALFEPLMLSLASVAAGTAGGKAWFIAVHRGREFGGWCIQGFVTGAAIAVGVAAAAGPGVPAGAFLAAAAPALLIGMAIGRPGCFFAGCCTGRPTASRWGVWSSDRVLGCRRAPAQLVEALAALLVGLSVLGVELTAGLDRSGPLAAGGLAAYTLVRQFILRLRNDPPRRSRYGRQVTITAAAAVLVASLALFAAGLA
jgi:phosphatidylglycerol---prolipoprotein diacylglyceryl transferase